MIVSDETIHAYGIDRKDVVWRRIGNRRYPVILVDATEELYKAYMEPLWHEIKCADREGRCMVKGKSGKLVRCPDSNKCNQRKHYSDTCMEHNRPASLSYLSDVGAEPVADESFEEEIIVEILLNDLVDMLAEINSKYGKIFRMLYDQKNQRQIADELGINSRTLSDDVKKVRTLAETFVKDSFDR